MRGLVAFRHFLSLFCSLLVTTIQAQDERVGCFQTFFVTFFHFWSQKFRLSMRGLVVFRHFLSLFSLLVTKIQAQYERVGCFHTFLVTFFFTFGHNNSGSL
jgi:hypothetical protein